MINTCFRGAELPLPLFLHLSLPVPHHVCGAAELWMVPAHATKEIQGKPTFGLWPKHEL